MSYHDMSCHSNTLLTRSLSPCCCLSIRAPSLVPLEQGQGLGQGLGQGQGQGQGLGFSDLLVAEDVDAVVVPYR